MCIFLVTALVHLLQKATVDGGSTAPARISIVNLTFQIELILPDQEATASPAVFPVVVLAIIPGLAAHIPKQLGPKCDSWEQENGQACRWAFSSIDSFRAVTDGHDGRGNKMHSSFALERVTAPSPCPRGCNCSYSIWQYRRRKVPLWSVVSPAGGYVSELLYRSFTSPEPCIMFA